MSGAQKDSDLRGFERALPDSLLQAVGEVYASKVKDVTVQCGLMLSTHNPSVDISLLTHE